jgi:hypothetical protein
MTMPHRRERLVRVDFTRKRGKHVGRPRKLTPEQIAHARDAIDDGKQTCGSMAVRARVPADRGRCEYDRRGLPKSSLPHYCRRRKSRSGKKSFGGSGR